jgi:predicted transcriptional regulator
MAKGLNNNLVTLSVATRSDVLSRAKAAFAGQAQGARISFASAELLWQVLTRKRWELLREMTGAGVISIREAARRVRRDVKAVHGDIQALLEAGIVERRDGGVVFPYAGVHVDFTLGMAA